MNFYNFVKRDCIHEHVTFGRSLTPIVYGNIYTIIANCINTINSRQGIQNNSPVIKGLRFKKIKSKGFMVYSNALIYLLFRKKVYQNFSWGTI